MEQVGQVNDLPYLAHEATLAVLSEPISFHPIRDMDPAQRFAYRCGLATLRGGVSGPIWRLCLHGCEVRPS